MSKASLAASATSARGAEPAVAPMRSVCEKRRRAPCLERRERARMTTNSADRGARIPEGGRTALPQRVARTVIRWHSNSRVVC